MSLTSCRMMVMSLNRISKRLPFSEWNFKYTTKNGFFEKKKCLLLEAYPEKCQTSKMELFANFQPLTNYVKNSILYVRQGSEYNSDQPIK